MFGLAKQDGEILKSDNTVDDEEMDETWKALQQQTCIKGQGCFENGF